MKQFEKIRVNKPKSSVFDLSHERKFTCNMGELVPIFLQETLPGDKFRVNWEMLLRMQPMIAPMMHRVNVYAHFFFVPNRIMWQDWEDFITGGKDGKQAPVFPTFSGTQSSMHTTLGDNKLADYMGIPIKNFDPTGTGTQAPKISQLPFRAYQQIYNDYYRDETLQNEVPYDKGSGDLDVADHDGALDIRIRCWEKDYFTSALPFAQRGDAVQLPLGASAPLSLINNNAAVLTDVNGASFSTLENLQVNAASNMQTDNAGTDKNVNVDVTDSHVADLSNATSADVSDIRRAFSIQRWMEKMARGGYRYIEQMLVMFGVKSKDARLQRAEYLGGGKLPVQISEVLQTGETATTPQGTMAGHGVSSGQTAGFNHYFTEHGLVIGLLSIMPRTNYSQGLPKIFSKFDKFDYYWPELAHIGEQPVKNQELFLSKTEAPNEQTFGYQPRYSEYRYAIDTVHGEMRTSLDFWHLGRKFTTLPTLNSDFVESDPSTRVFAVQSGGDHFVIQSYCNFSAIRPVSKFGDPI